MGSQDDPRLEAGPGLREAKGGADSSGVELVGDLSGVVQPGSTMPLHDREPMESEPAAQPSPSPSPENNGVAIGGAPIDGIAPVEEPDDPFAGWTTQELAHLDLALELGTDFDELADASPLGTASKLAATPSSAGVAEDGGAVSARVGARVRDYHRVLEHTRGALLEVELPGGPGSLFERIESSARLPAGGLVESGQHVASPSPVASIADARAARAAPLRAAIAPLLALAAGVALIFMFARHQGGSPGGDPSVARRDEKSAALPTAPAKTDDRAATGLEAEDVELDLNGALARGQESAAPSAAPSAAAIGQEVPLAEAAISAADSSDFAAGASPSVQEKDKDASPAKAAGKSGGGSASGGARPKEDAKPTDSAQDSNANSQSESASKGDQWSDIESVHTLRRKGRCALAIDEYEAIIVGNPVNLVRARAEAGLALCLESTGRASEAKTHFALAKQLDPSIDTFIERERNKMPMSDEKRSSKAKKQEAFDDLP